MHILSRSCNEESKAPAMPTPGSAYRLSEVGALWRSCCPARVLRRGGGGPPHLHGVLWRGAWAQAPSGWHGCPTMPERNVGRKYGRVPSRGTSSGRGHPPILSPRMTGGSCFTGGATLVLCRPIRFSGYGSAADGLVCRPIRTLSFAWVTTTRLVRPLALQLGARQAQQGA